MVEEVIKRWHTYSAARCRPCWEILFEHMQHLELKEMMIMMLMMITSLYLKLCLPLL